MIRSTSFKQDQLQQIVNNKMEKQSQVFFVLPEQIAQFKRLQSVANIVSLKSIQQDWSTQAVLNSLKYRYVLNYLGKSYEDLTVLCIPAREHKVNNSEVEQPAYPTLIKVQANGDVKGYLSGKRSAILIADGKLIRYKGCGNNTEGFIFENKQIRGSHFLHTAKRQLFMTNLINKFLLQEVGIQSANKPLFYYEFNNTVQKLSLKNQLPLIGRYCCVFETVGDRRVGTHLISPLQILFLNSLDIKNSNLQAFFTKQKRMSATEEGLVQLLTDFDMFLDEGESFLKKYDACKQFQNYVTLTELASFNNKPVKILDNFRQIVQNMSDKFGSQNIKTLLCSNQVDWIQIINILLQKLGWQMGQIKRIFCQKQINWGFFNDHGYWHCNAHLNNFIVNPPKNNSRFIQPLDFDLAFTKEEYINIDLDSPNYGKRDDFNFQQLLLAEYNAMEMSVSGLQIMNFKYSIDDNVQPPSNQIKMARIVFRDTLIKAFRWGMHKNQTEFERINSNWNSNVTHLHQLIEACLTMSVNFQT